MKTLAIVGGGITGITCAYKLQNEYRVTLFEKEAQLGGQAQTFVINDIPVESAVSVVGELTYTEFFKLMNEINFNQFKSYELSGVHIHDRTKSKLYIDTKLKRLKILLPKFIKDSPLGIVKTLLLIPFLYRLYFDFRKGKLDDALVLDAYTLYPRYTFLIPTVLTLLSLITAVEVKNATIAHVMNFIFDSEKNKRYSDPVKQVIQTFLQTKIPENGVSAYIQKIKESTNTDFKQGSTIKRVTRNQDSTLTITDGQNQTHTFDKVIIASQPFQVSEFLDYKNPEEEMRFECLSKLITHCMVTNHTDLGILNNLKVAEGLVDFRLDYHENTSQTTITREKHFYTAQTLPDSFNREKAENTKEFTDTQQTPDNYSIDKSKILSQHFHAVQYMTPKTAQLFSQIIEQSGEDNLYFACAALSNYPTSQEGGVRSALRVIEEIHAT